jgi:type I pantothenate kinase
MDDTGGRQPAADPVSAPGFVTFTRPQWADLGRAGRPRGRDGGVERESGPVAERELVEVYRPLSRLLDTVASARRARAKQVAETLELSCGRGPFLIGVAGSVAVGKSTVARDLARVLSHCPGFSPVDVISTDSFLYPNDELAARGMTDRKGFPESYDRRRLVATLAAVRGGEEGVEIPVYSHRDYDIVPGRCHRVDRPAAVIVEGLNVLQVGPYGAGGSDPPTPVSDFLDWSIYVDAAEADIARWHRQRLFGLRRAGPGEATGFLRWFCSLSEEEARAVVASAWTGINSVNLRDHIAPTRVRASMILYKQADHRVSHVLVREV